MTKTILFFRNFLDIFFYFRTRRVLKNCIFLSFRTKKKKNILTCPNIYGKYIQPDLHRNQNKGLDRLKSLLTLSPINWMLQTCDLFKQVHSNIHCI